MAWSLDDIPWQDFKPEYAEPELISLAKAASLVEYNSGDYARYLHEVFGNDESFRPAIEQWAVEERQHGLALKRWVEMADPNFSFDESFAMFLKGFQLPTDVKVSVRGSKTGELIARCVVETGTSSYYTAIKDYTKEPVLKAICAKIAADEFRHYKLFYDQLKTYVEQEKVPFLKRFGVALGRIVETEDDELAYAYYASHYRDFESYDRKKAASAYSHVAYRFYRRDHIERMCSMIFKAVGLKPNTLFHRGINRFAWYMLQRKAVAA